MTLQPGLTGQAETTVTQANTAAAMGSGLLPVFATPCMAALMEAAAVDACQTALDEGSGTVGTRLEITHDPATPIGMTVRAEAVLTAAEGRKLTFTVRAFDGAGPIGGGIHERFIIDNDRFLAKARKRGEG